jgi:hypothetical protein
MAPWTLPGYVLIISGGGKTDTVEARIEFPLIVQIKDSTSRAIPDKWVNFRSLYTTQSGSQMPAHLSGLGQENWISESIDVSDSQGLARTLVRLEPVEGTALVEWSARELGMADTISFTIAQGTR